jgi:hypothetical protein
MRAKVKLMKNKFAMKLFYCTLMECLYNTMKISIKFRPCPMADRNIYPFSQSSQKHDFKVLNSPMPPKVSDFIEDSKVCGTNL